MPLLLPTWMSGMFARAEQSGFGGEENQVSLPQNVTMLFAVLSFLPTHIVDKLSHGGDAALGRTGRCNQYLARVATTAKKNSYIAQTHLFRRRFILLSIKVRRHGQERLSRSLPPFYCLHRITAQDFKTRYGATPLPHTGVYRDLGILSLDRVAIETRVRARLDFLLSGQKNGGARALRCQRQTRLRGESSISVEKQ